MCGGASMTLLFDHKKESRELYRPRRVLLSLVILRLLLLLLLFILFYHRLLSPPPSQVFTHIYATPSNMGAPCVHLTVRRRESINQSINHSINCVAY